MMERKLGTFCGSWLIFYKDDNTKTCTFMSLSQLKVSERERERNGKDAITTQNLFKLEAGLQVNRD